MSLKKWIPLKGIKGHRAGCELKCGKTTSTLFAVDHNEYFIIRSGPLDDLCHGVYRYGIDQNKWEKVVDFGGGLRMIRNEVALDMRTKTLFLWDGAAEIFAIGLDSMTIKPVWSKYRDGPSLNFINAMAWIDGKIHLIGGGYLSNSPFHFVADSNSTQLHFQKVHEFEFSQWSTVQLLHLKKKQSMLMIVSKHGGGVWTSIQEYSIRNNKWRTLKMPIPKEMEWSVFYNRRMIATNDERCVIFFITGTDLIFFHDFETNKTSRLMTRWPGKNIEAIMVSNEQRDELLAHGYVRQHTCNAGIEPMPKCLSQLINAYVSNEFIHVVHKRIWSKEGANHWKMHVDGIFQTTQSEEDNTAIEMYSRKRHFHKKKMCLLM